MQKKDKKIKFQKKICKKGTKRKKCAKKAYGEYKL